MKPPDKNEKEVADRRRLFKEQSEDLKYTLTKFQRNSGSGEPRCAAPVSSSSGFLWFRWYTITVVVVCVPCGRGSIAEAVGLHFLRKPSRRYIDVWNILLTTETRRVNVL